MLTDGECAVWAWWPVSAKGAKGVTYTVVHANGSTPVTVNQNVNGGKWTYLGSFTFARGRHEVQISNVAAEAGKKVMADAVRFTWGAGSSTTALRAGLKGEYYNNPDFTELKRTRYDAQVNFNWGIAPPAAGVGANSFSVRWNGFLRAPATGTYTLYTVSDDGVKLYVNDLVAPLIDAWTAHPSREDKATIALTEGQVVPIRIEFFDDKGVAKMILKWSGPGIGKSIVPTSALWSLP